MDTLAETGGGQVLVVGPSGAGKDTVLAGLREILEDKNGFVFARREITRDADAGGEDHVAIDEATFQRREAAGGYALSWRAHGLCYGVPRTIEDDLRAGRMVLANTSRAMIAPARQRYPGVQTVVITAPAAVLAERLAVRGRESRAEVLARLARSAPDIPQGDDIWEINNTGTPRRVSAACAMP